jgi:hypothetical protein
MGETTRILVQLMGGGMSFDSSFISIDGKEEEGRLADEPAFLEAEISLVAVDGLTNDHMIH